MSSQKVVVFQSGNEEYAVSIDHVVSIEKLDKVNPIPHLPTYLIGLMNIRGELVPIIDFEQILYNQSGLMNANARVVTMHTDEMLVGILVKEAKEILDLPSESLKQLGIMNYSKTNYFTNIANLEERMITIVDPSILVRSLEGLKNIQSYLEVNKGNLEVSSL